MQQHDLGRKATVFAVHSDHRDYAMTVLLDSGASHSIINEATVKQLSLSVKPPSGPVTEVTLADGKTKMQRIGTVELDLHIYFMNTDRQPARLHLRCKVMPLMTDLLFGVEALHALFPNDSISQFFIPPSMLASVPQPLTVELTMEDPSPTSMHFRMRPEGHLTRATRTRNHEAVVAALDLIEQVADSRCKHVLTQAFGANQSAEEDA